MEKASYYTNRHSCYFLQYHLVVMTKYRHPVIKNDIENELILITNKLFKENWDANILSINTDLDHIHILFEAKPQVQLSKLVNNFKTVTSRLLRKKFSQQLEEYYWKPYFWSKSYFICTVSERSESIVKKYIEEQGKN